MQRSVPTKTPTLAQKLQAQLAQLAPRLQQVPLPLPRRFRKQDNILLLQEAHFHISGNKA
jgi:hypothetical protein